MLLIITVDPVGKLPTVKAGVLLGGLYLDSESLENISTKLDILTTTDNGSDGLPKYSYKLKLDLLEVISTVLMSSFQAPPDLTYTFLHTRQVPYFTQTDLGRYQVSSSFTYNPDIRLYTKHLHQRHLMGLN